MTSEYNIYIYTYWWWAELFSFETGVLIGSLRRICWKYWGMRNSHQQVSLDFRRVTAAMDTTQRR